MPDLTDLLDERDGIARRATLYARGISKHRISSALDRGEIVPVGRLWVAARNVDQLLMSAARAGVVLTCVTATARAGLWLTHPEQHAHVTAPTRTSRLEGAVVHVHWGRPLVPRHPDTLVDALENALNFAATCLPHDDALAVMESGVRMGAIDPQVMTRLPLSPAARALLRDAQSYSDSGLETVFFSRLRWLRVSITPQAWIHGHRVDFLLGQRLVVQIDGGHHVGPQREADLRHDADLTLRGYHVIRVSYADVMSRWPELQRRVQLALAQGLHRAS